MGSDRIVLSDNDEWEIRSWPQGMVVNAGQGLAIPDGVGRRWAAVTAEGVEVDGGRHALPGSIHPRGEDPTSPSRFSIERDQGWETIPELRVAGPCQREGAADHRLVDARTGGDPFRRARWGTPADNRDAWELASPVTRASAVRTPMLLLYGEDGCPEQGDAWHAALSRAGVPVELWIYPGGHMPGSDVVDEIYRRAAAWFRRWEGQIPLRSPLTVPPCPRSAG